MARENAAFPVDAVDTEGTTELPFNVPAANGVASGSTNDSLLHEARAAPTPSAATQVMRCMAEDLHERVGGWGDGLAGAYLSRRKAGRASRVLLYGRHEG